MPTNQRKKRVISPEESVNAVSNLLNKATGNMLGRMAERAILGGRQGTGQVKFSETPEGKKRKYLQSHKGLFVKDLP